MRKRIPGKTNSEQDNNLLLAGGMVLLTIMGYLGYEYKIRSENKEMLESSNRPIYATVLEKKYVPENNNSPSSYSLKVMADKRTLEINIIDSKYEKKESLENRIEPGTKISFPRGNLKIDGYRLYECKGNNEIHETYFKEGITLGYKRADRIKIRE